MASLKERLVRTGLVLTAATAAVAGAGTEADASAKATRELAVQNDGKACAVTQLDNDGKTIGFYESIFNADGSVTGPSPDRLAANNKVAQQMEKGIKDEADYLTTLENGDEVAISFKNGVCVVDRFSQHGGKTALYENIVNADGSVTGPSPDFVTPEIKATIEKAARYIIK